MSSDPRARPKGQVDFELVFHMLPGMCLVLDPAFTILAQSEARPAKPVKSIQWIDLSAERRELGRAASMPAQGDC